MLSKSFFWFRRKIGGWRRRGTSSFAIEVSLSRVTIVLPTAVGPDGITGVADVAAAAHVVGMQDVEADDLSGVAVPGDGGIGLAGEEAVGLVRG